MKERSEDTWTVVTVVVGLAGILFFCLMGYAMAYSDHRNKPVTCTSHTSITGTTKTVCR